MALCFVVVNVVTLAVVIGPGSVKEVVPSVSVGEPETVVLASVVLLLSVVVVDLVVVVAGKDLG